MNILAKSFMDIQKMYMSDVKPEQRDVLLLPQDLIIKSLSFIEFWKQKNTQKQNVIFIVRIMNMLLKNAQDPEFVLGAGWASGGLGLGNLLGGLGGLLKGKS